MSEEAFDFGGLQVNGKTTVVPKTAELSKVRLNDHKLPKSFRDFASQYGYGVLCNMLIIYVPMDYPDSLDIRCQELQRMLNFSVSEELFEYEPHGSPELVKRLLPFGISENGHTLTWDPTEVANGEFPIYVIGPKCLSVTRVANNMYQFVSGCVTSEVKAILGPGYQPLPATFRPVKPVK